ncbi:invasion associated locus B family protein [Pararhodobacter sp.]|uniref:invasion associated locus B family protein n=1 Tax=Pararhodobacter sp. TaxID=2127056 RepID=UPI002FDD38E5
MAEWFKTGATALAMVALMAGGAIAQESTNRVAVETAWSVFVDGNPRECWAVSAPSETVNTRGGQAVTVQRGDILLFATYHQGGGATAEVSFTGGYPFAEGSTVELVIGTDTLQLFTDGQWAWAASPEDDARILASLRRGQNAVLTARSSRGTTTRDTFSLFGITAATDEAQRRCNE